MRDANQIIKESFNVACDKNKFRTWAKIFRQTIEPNFSAEINPYGTMTFQEWAGYYIGDYDWGYTDQKKIKSFYKLIKDKDLI